MIDIEQESERATDLRCIHAHGKFEETFRVSHFSLRCILKIFKLSGDIGKWHSERECISTSTPVS